MANPALSLVEAALEAWAECQPEGYWLPERRALSLLLTLGAHLPGGEQNLGARARCLEALLPGGNICLRATAGEVHLLHFWRAYSHVARLVSTSEEGEAALEEGCVAELEGLRDTAMDLMEASATGNIKASALATPMKAAAENSAVPAFWRRVADSLSTEEEMGMHELTVLLLSWLHDAVMWQHSPGQTLHLSMMPMAAHAPALDLSCTLWVPPPLPTLDSQLGCSLISNADSPNDKQDSPLRTLSLDRPSKPGSRHSTLPAQPRPPTTLRTLMTSEALLLDLEEQWRASGAFADKRPNARSALMAETPDSPLSPLGQTLLPEEVLATPPRPLTPGDVPGRPEGPPPPLPMPAPPRLAVNLHIYDVSQEASIRRLNAVLSHWRSPIKLGGVFHAGVEVDGVEWSYGKTIFPGMTGVCRTDPKADPNHHFRETVQLAPTELTKEDVLQLIVDLSKEYLGDDYNLLRRNCCHFADDFCQRLGVGRIPAWVYRLARIGARIDKVLRPISGLQGCVSSAASSQCPSSQAAPLGVQPEAIALLAA